MLCVVMLAANCKKDDTTTTPPADARDVFIGNFHMSDSSQLQMTGAPWQTYTLDIVITKSPTDASKIIITNLNNVGYTTTANVSASIFIITNQPFGPMPNNTINGSGKFENNKLSYEYNINTTGGGLIIKGQGTKFTK